VENRPYIKAIETRYRNYRFRSRLEARWAVVFDVLGMEWEYEREGFDLPGGRYLPDFWVPYRAATPPGWGFWIEIKPDVPTERETQLCSDLARLSGHRTFVLCGDPGFGKPQVFVFDHHHNGVPRRIPMIAGGRLIEYDPTAGTEFEGHQHKIAVEYTGDQGVGRFPFCVGSQFTFNMETSLAKAVEAARSARFEHGESPHV
jgi:hypothetical protein